MKKYCLRYRYKKYRIWGNDSEWKIKSYVAQDLNDLIEKINSIGREYAEFYIIAIFEIGN